MKIALKLFQVFRTKRRRDEKWKSGRAGKAGDLVLVAVFWQLQRCRSKIHECEKPQQEKSHIEAVERASKVSTGKQKS